MTIAVTAATGHLGHLTVQALLDRGVPAGQVVALARTPEKAADLAALGVQVRRADHREQDSLRAALRGVDKLLLISGDILRERVEQHRNVVDAAREAGVGLVAYTSGPRADTGRMLILADHLATEVILRESGVPFVFLRNCFYTENYMGNLAQTLERGVILGAADEEGRFTPAARRDYAEAAAAVLASEGHENAVYELGGDESVTMTDIAAELSRQSGRPVRYKRLAVEEYARMLEGYGLPPEVAAVLADEDDFVERGELATDSADLRRLIGRPTTRLADVVAAALKG